MPVDQAVIENLKAIVGPQRVSTSRMDKVIYRHCLAYDVFPWEADVIVMPESDIMGNSPIPRIVGLANRYRIPLTVKGGIGSGGSQPREGGILLDLSRMDKVLSVDPDRLSIVAEAGASVHELQYQARLKDMHIPNYGTMESAATVGATVSRGGNGYGMTNYGQFADLCTGLEVVTPSGEVLTVGSLANQNTDFGPFQRHVNGPDPLSVYINSLGNFGIITKVAMRCISLKREHIYPKCFCWRRDQIKEFQKAMMDLARARVYDIHFNDRWNIHWAIEDGDLLTVPPEGWFFLQILLVARNKEELAGQEKLLGDICGDLGGVEVPEIASKHVMGPEGLENLRVHWHIGGPHGWAAQTSRHTGMFMVGISCYYPLSRFSEVYALDEAAKKEAGLWDPRFFPQHDSYVTNDLSIKEEMFAAYNPYNLAHKVKLGKWRSLIIDKLVRQGAVYSMPYLYGMPRFGFEKLGPCYDWIKDYKRIQDPNNIMNPGTMV